MPIENIVQRDVIERAKAISDKVSGFLGHRGRTEKQRKSHFYYILKKCGVTLADEGVTAHGLRHQYMHQSYLRLTGIEPPVRGGDPSTVDKHELHVATQQLMERAGHSRTSIGVAYYGSGKLGGALNVCNSAISDKWCSISGRLVCRAFQTIKL